jgi:hypothetical protein
MAAQWEPPDEDDPAPSRQPMRIWDAEGRELSLDDLAKLLTTPPIPTKADLRKQILFNQRHRHVVTGRRLRAKIAAETVQMQEALHRRSTPSEARPRQVRGTSRMRRTRRVARTCGSRGDPHQDDDDSETDHRVVRPPLTRAERVYLKAEVDRMVRQGIAGQQVVDRALFRAVEAWGSAEVVVGE